MNIAITGHRPNKLGNDYNLTSPLILKIKSKLEEIVDSYKPECLISGMALGIDTLWAKIALEKRIPLICAIPCINQEKLWTDSSKELYRYILDNAYKVVYITKKEFDYKSMQLRNEWMVDNCDILVAVHDGSYGGTHNCVTYANQVGKEIITINPNEIK